MREWLGPNMARQPADPRRGAPRRAVERRALRHRDQVHARGPRHRRPLRAPPLPLRHAAQRPLEQLLHAARAPRPVSLHSRRQGRRRHSSDVMVRRLKEDIRAIQGGSLKRIVVRIEHRGAAGRCARARVVTPARRVPRRPARLGSPARRSARRPLRACSSSALQQRLLSSIEAFARSLKVHRATVRAQWKGPATRDTASPQGSRTGSALHSAPTPTTSERVTRPRKRKPKMTRPGRASPPPRKREGAAAMRLQRSSGAGSRSCSTACRRSPRRTRPAGREDARAGRLDPRASAPACRPRPERPKGAPPSGTTAAS
jgi:hypothetical protein